MNRAFDYNGVQISASRPVQKLVKRHRILHIDSVDRDITFFPNNGNFTIYLPRAYERVSLINIKSAEFPQAVISGSSNINSWVGPDTTGSGSVISVPPNYFFLEAKGLNMSDETAPSADRSASTNSVFAKFVIADPTDPVIIYNESSDAHQEIEFFPPLTKLDRFHFRVRTHGMDANSYMYWSAGDWSISLDIETLENVFDEFSSIETRIGDRS